MRTFCYLGSMACYDKSVNSSKELSRWGVEAGLTVPYEVGAAGVVIYQEQEAVHEPAQLATQLTNVTGAPNGHTTTHFQIHIFPTIFSKFTTCTSLHASSSE